MAKMTAEERAELESRLAADDDADDDDDEYEVGFGDGSYIRGKHKRVSKVAAARGFKLDADPDPGKDGDGGDGGGGKGGGGTKPKGQAPRTGGAQRFGRRVS